MALYAIRLKYSGHEEVLGENTMSERNLLEGISPVTQTIESGKALAKFLGLSEELPESIALANGARLTLSSKKDRLLLHNAAELHVQGRAKS